MTIQEIINYITHTPENTNPSILKDMLKQISGNSGSDDMYQNFINNIVFIPVNKTTIYYEEYDENWNIYTIDYSIEELLAQYNSGKMCCVYFTDPVLTQNQVYWTILAGYEPGENENSLYFRGEITNDSTHKIFLTYDPESYAGIDEFSISPNSVFAEIDR